MMNITELVKSILYSYPGTRDDDYLLWLKAVQLGVPRDKIHNYMTMSFYDFMQYAKYMKIPHFETVSRIRRKLQENYPDLRASAETKAARARLEEEYREFARSIV